MNTDFLDFEKPIAEFEAKIEALQLLKDDNGINISEEIDKLKQKSAQLTKTIFAKLTPGQIVQLSRHNKRPHTIDYINHLISDFDELHGDRYYSHGASIIGGIGRFENRPVMIMGHEKGRKTKDKLKHNFGMPSPEDYRKSQRLMKMAEKFRLPIITFIDTPGAYPGITAEQHNQSEAIARNLFMMSKLKTPIISIVIGEGGSGGALALSVSDCLLMLEYSTYSVITPEGCASILWKKAENVAEAALALGLTAEKIKQLGIIDAIIKEPLGGAHRNIAMIMKSVGSAINDTLNNLLGHEINDLVKKRYDRLLNYRYRGKS